jgi:hypothetical protein
VIAQIEDLDIGDNHNLQRTNRLHDALAEDNAQIKRDKTAMESTLGTRVVLSTDSQPQGRPPFVQSEDSSLQEPKKDKKDKKDKKKKHKKHKSRKRDDDY